MKKFKKAFAELVRVLHFFHVFLAKLAGNTLGGILLESIAIALAVWLAHQISDKIANIIV